MFGLKVSLTAVRSAAIAIAVVYVPIFARLARNLALTVREEAYVQAARLMGQSTTRILAREVLPNIMAPIMVQASISVAFGVIIEAGLSFLGLGVQPPTPSWGLMIAEGKDYMFFSSWVIMIPGIALFVLILGINLVGDGLRNLLGTEKLR